jgi:hypothetical protein
MMDIFIGGIVAIISSIITHIVTIWMREHGKVYCYLETWDISLIRSEQDTYGQVHRKRIKSVDEADFISYFLMIDLFNNSEVPVALRELEFKFIGQSYTISKQPHLEGEHYIIGNDSDNDSLYVNLPSKQMTRLQFNGEFFNKEEFASIANCSAVQLVAKYHNGKRFMYKISDIKLFTEN